MKHVFIINPVAGSRNRTKEYKAKIEQSCGKRRLPYKIHVSRSPGDCTRIAAHYAKSGENVLLYACGGDGTLNEVVNGAVGCPNAAVTVFSGGSGNDFVKVFDKPESFFDLEQLLDARETEMDLIRCNGDYALNICSVGLDARIGTDVSNYKRLPLVSGFGAYAVSTVVNVLRGIGEHYVVEVDGQRFDQEMTMICVCNGSYYGGGFHPVPDADPTDGKLDILLVEKVSRLQVPQVVGKYKDGQYRSLPHLIKHFRTEEIKIICDRETPVNLDGELRLAKEISFSVAKEKLRFFHPKAASLRLPELEKV
ncbi:MAG: diacylglycerol kinase family lipid kinase [Oscillospiraceae bacterium]|nr:diacylglycerol kinase family lipid kinase [Oscillospiraceae bacterium]